MVTGEWIEWKGGPIDSDPVGDLPVEVIFRGSKSKEGMYAGPSDELAWDHVGNGEDIIAYRIVEKSNG